MYKYQLEDDESGLNIGYCENIIGFSGVRQYTKQRSSELSLVGLTLSDEYINHCLVTKSKTSAFHIKMLSQHGQAIGSYYFVLDKSQSFHKNNISQIEFDMDLSGAFATSPSFEAMKIWNMWMISKPTKLNTWAALSRKKKLGWLEVARIHAGMNLTRPDHINDHYSIDMTHVKDSLSFYCALGEAINGPGGYYGFNLDSLQDCLYGNFGAMLPFTLYFCNGDLSLLINWETIHESERAKLQKILDLLVSNQVTLVSQ